MLDVAGMISFPPMNKAVHKLNQERPALMETQTAKVTEKKVVKKATNVQAEGRTMLRYHARERDGIITFLEGKKR
jgi:hypothetical protein